MKLNALFVGCITMSLALLSCKSTSHTTVSTDVDGPTVIQKPVIADLNVGDKRVTGTASGKGTVAEIKDLAILDAITKAKADVLVEPRFTIEESFNKASVTVTGYPGTYKNFRPIEAADTIFVDRNELSSVKADRRTTRRNGRGGKIAGIAGGSVVGLIGIVLLWSWLF